MTQNVCMSNAAATSNGYNNTNLERRHRVTFEQLASVEFQTEVDKLFSSPPKSLNSAAIIHHALH